MKPIMGALIILGAMIATPAAAQQQTGGAIVSVYRAAPGHQEQLLTWFAQQEAINKAAGIPPTQLYVHQDGASWDFLIVAPQTTPQQDQAFDAAARRMGAPVGPRAGLELRKHIAEHTDTFVAGPTTATEWLEVLRR